MTPLVGDAALALALAGQGELLVRLRAAEPARPWWFGYARDGANLASALMLWGAYWMAGFAVPVSLLAGLLTCLAAYLLDWMIARAFHVRHARLVLTVPLFAWLAFVVFLPDDAQRGLAWLLALGRP